MTPTHPSARRLAFVLVLVTMGIVAPQHPSAQSGIPADLVLYASHATVMNGAFQRVNDTTAAGGVRLWQPDLGAPKITSPSATPRDYFDLSFQAEAGRAYRLWLRGLAQANSYHNDSVYVQFSGSVDASGTPVYRIGTTSGTAVVIEDCSGCGVSGWGWQDNAYGGTALGPAIYFATTGPQTLRIQAREDGISIDQIVLSSSAYFTTRPGALKNDTTILPETGSGSASGAAGPVAFSIADYTAGSRYDLAAIGDINGDGRPDAIGFYDNEPLEFHSHVNNGDRTFTQAQFIEDLGGGQYGALAMAVADFTRDGRKDVLFLHGTANALWLGTGDGAGHFTFGTGALSFAEKVTDFAAADFDRDGVLDVVTIEPDRNSAVIYQGDGTGHFSFVAYGTTVTTPTLVTTGDVDGDGRVDALVLSRTADTLSIMYGDGTGRFRSRSDLPAGASPRGLALGDLNRDGRTDLAIENAGGATVYIAAAGGGWEAARQIDTTQTATGYTRDRNVAIADMNGDAIPDLLVSHQHGRADIGFWNSVSVLYGDGSGGFSAPDEFSVTAYAPAMAVADFDGDGRLDIFGAERATIAWNAAFTGNHQPAAQPRAWPAATITTAQESTSYLWSASTDPDGHLLKYSWKDASGKEISDGAMAYPFNYVQQPAGTYTYALTVDDMHGATATATLTVTITSDATGVNNAPVAQANVSMNGVWPYEAQFQDEPDPNTYVWSTSTDPDGDPLGYEWRDETGRLLGTDSWVDHAHLVPGTHTITLTVRDGRGGVSQDAVSVQVLPYEEINISMGYKEWTQGQWHETNLTDNWVVIGDTNNSAPKVTTPLAAPASYAELGFVADPTLEYKLWVRLKAENDYWGNDSVWVQFSGAADAAGNPVFRTGTTSGLMVNLEECSGCGLSGWGWRDDAWGTAGAMSGTLLRFPEGGVQSLRIQTREDGVSIDQVVLSARKYKTTRPGAVKNDATVLPFTAMWGS